MGSITITAPTFAGTIEPRLGNFEHRAGTPSGLILADIPMKVIATAKTKSGNAKDGKIVFSFNRYAYDIEAAGDQAKRYLGFAERQDRLHAAGFAPWGDPGGERRRSRNDHRNRRRRCGRNG